MTQSTSTQQQPENTTDSKNRPITIDAKLIPHDAKAVVFDCDGTLVDSMPAHFIAWSHVASRYNFSFPEDLFYEWGGITARQIIKDLAEQQNLGELPVDEIITEKGAFLAKYEEDHALEAVAEVVAHLHYLREHRPDVKLAVCSGGERKTVMRALNILKLDTAWFGAIVTSEDYPKGKPEPDAYLVTAQKLGVEPKYCVGVEDTNTGLKSIEAAGYMKGIDVRDLRKSTQKKE
uniref:Uncharacterized protein n=1 Tax=Percolomonas cosmopolitus TaxID=63605 RepID=A0A7S1PGG5_9EUKA|mmetsp:Transcript_2025/g.7267  ORF Transcript_2025/g.7267 Transcript_2025/m.7267 type:complete len:233 (+) Transcript_2025:125-823(+)|eukprot:CAMPEP_0117449092 /NCGR_PEP_ID=MMETSP0759-20121206/7760_1 /TAXON_ID=63605 /ORGANISM="Percolomonas cosmopolitus, Strain WS" /LENGTH=232 /DNA_ID=CAMNT_0005241543 /DNA_START=47 /DNA_END=745 /DNA_ORIENTATION=+